MVGAAARAELPAPRAARERLDFGVVHDLDVGRIGQSGGTALLAGAYTRP